MLNYEGKKIAILRGYPRLIDGESTSVEEMFTWGKENNVEIHTYYYHGLWKRKKPDYDDGYLHTFTIFNQTMIEEIKEELNGYDLIILINPSKPHSGISKLDVVKFHEMYLELTPIKVQMQHTSFIKAINETPFCWSYINASDAVYNHSDKSYYMNSLVKKLPSKMQRAFPMHLWMNVKKFEDLYKNEEREVNLTYIGRPVLYKGPKRLLDISEAVLANGIKPVIYGMDTSVGTKKILLWHRNCNNLLQPKAPKNENSIVDTYGKLERQEVFNTFNKSLFACSLFRFRTNIDKTFYGDRLEYTMQEAICAGSILVIDKEWAESCKTIDGIRYIDIPNFGIVMDENFPNGAIEKMKEVAKDKELQKIYRDTAFQILMKEYDSTFVLPKIMSELFSITRDDYKFSTVFDLVKYLTKSEEKAAEFVKLYQDNELLPMVPQAISENIISYFTGKYGKSIREYKGENECRE